jgi:hypothetical protein
VPKK